MRPLVLVNRIKEHTDIDWPVPLPAGRFGLESGFAKILALGLSKMQAIEMHRHIPGIGLGAAIEASARRTIGGTELKIAGGLGIIENAFDETAEIIGVPVETVDRFFATEAAALGRSRTLMPSLPVMDLDLLYCAYLGKDKSGQGMHTKTIGRSPYGYVQGRRGSRRCRVSTPSSAVGSPRGATATRSASGFASSSRVVSTRPWTGSGRP